MMIIFIVIFVILFVLSVILFDKIQKSNIEIATSFFDKAIPLPIVRNPGDPDFASRIVPVQPITDPEEAARIQALFKAKFPGVEIVVKSSEEPVCRRHCPL